MIMKNEFRLEWNPAESNKSLRIEMNCTSSSMALELFQKSADWRGPIKLIGLI